MEICQCPVTKCDYRPQEGGFCHYCKDAGCVETAAVLSRVER